VFFKIPLEIEIIFLDDGKRKHPGLDLQEATAQSLHQTAAPPSANILIIFTKENRRHQQSSHGNLLSSNSIAKTPSIVGENSHNRCLP